jgi:hypothetical protein
MTLKNETLKLIHVAKIFPAQGKAQYLLLRQIADGKFCWFENDKEHVLIGTSVVEALQAARKHWKSHHFQTIHCGFRYTLPERDEHGCNALYYQMAASYNSSNGIYFDEELGHNCFVNFASHEALSLKKQFDTGILKLKFPL